VVIVDVEEDAETGEKALSFRGVEGAAPPPAEPVGSGPATAE
jgi:hypothetical protein